MLIRLRNIFCFLSFLGFYGISIKCHSASFSESHLLGGKGAMAAVHAVVTRTIVIDYAPFPELAGSIDKALFKEGETVVLEKEDSNAPCLASNDNSSSTPKGRRTSTPSVKIIAQHNHLCEGEVGTLTATGAESYSWSTGERSETIRIAPSVTSKFFVIGTNKEGCKDVAYFIQQVEACQPQQTAANELHIYPNPSTGHFFVKVSSTGNNLTLHIYNDQGRLVREEKIGVSVLEINLTNEPDGMYLVRLTDLGKEIRRQRIFKAP